MSARLTEGALFDNAPEWWVRFSPWTARLTAAAFATAPVEEVRLIGKGNPTFYPTPAGLKTLRGWAADNLSEDLAEWVADGLPKGARVVRSYVVGYKAATTGLSEDLLGPIDAASPEEAMEWAFASSGHDDKAAFFRDLEARLA